MKLRASKCHIMAVDKQIESEFLNENHYQGYVPSKVALGLFHVNELVCLMTFGKPRYNKGYDWELLRLCTKKDTLVYGGASRLWKHFTSNYTGSVVSYCNEDKFKGTVYEILGFRKTVTKKGYHYEKDGKTYHRTNFQKHMCLKRWPQYDQTWTERRMMEDQKKIVHKKGYKAKCHYVTQYQNKETLEIKSSKEWIDSGIDVYYHKDKFIKLAPKVVRY